MDERIDESFGAEVRLALPEPDGPQLFLIVSSGAHPAALVRAHRGRIALDGGTWVIAELGFGEGMALRKKRGVAFVGGLSLDPERFAAFGRLAGLGSSQTTAGKG